MESAQDWSKVLEGAEITRSAEDKARVRWRVNADLSAFEGHFPDNPIVPAVSILELSLYLARLLRMLPENRLQRIKNAKFFEPLRPGTQVEIDLCREAADGQHQLHVAWKFYTENAYAWTKGSEFDFSLSSSATRL